MISPRHTRPVSSAHSRPILRLRSPQPRTGCPRPRPRPRPRRGAHTGTPHDAARHRERTRTGTRPLHPRGRALRVVEVAGARVRRGGAGHGAAGAAGRRAARPRAAPRAAAGGPHRRHAGAVLRRHLGRATEPVRERGGAGVRAHALDARRRRARRAARRRGVRRGRALPLPAPRARGCAHAACARLPDLQGAVRGGAVRRVPGARQLRSVGERRRRRRRFVAAAHWRHRRCARHARVPADRRQHEPGTQLRTRARRRLLAPALDLLGRPA